MKRDKEKSPGAGQQQPRAGGTQQTGRPASEDNYTGNFSGEEIPIHCETCSSPLEGGYGLSRQKCELGGRTAYARPLVICRSCWEMADAERPEFLEFDVVKKQYAEMLQRLLSTLPSHTGPIQ